jgi:hypothetical protein
MPGLDRVHVAHAALVQVARRGVMDGVLPAPVKVWRERQHAQDRTDDVVGLFCQTLFHATGVWYLATASAQAGRADLALESVFMLLLPQKCALL